MKTLIQYAAHIAAGLAIGAVVSVGLYLTLVQMGMQP